MLLELDVLTDGLEIRFRAMFEFAVSGKGLESVFLNTRGCCCCCCCITLQSSKPLDYSTFCLFCHEQLPKYLKLTTMLPASKLLLWTKEDQFPQLLFRQRLPHPRTPPLIRAAPVDGTHPPTPTPSPASSFRFLSS